MGICTKPDEYVNDLRWIAMLSNGETVFQDDDRPGEIPCSAWSRLKAYCHDNRCGIVSMKLEFRSHVEEIPSNSDAYFFCRMAAAILCGDGQTFAHFVVGTYNAEKDVFELKSWKVPELIVVSEFDRSRVDTSEECIIWNADHLNLRGKPNFGNISEITS